MSYVSLFFFSYYLTVSGTQVRNAVNIFSSMNKPFNISLSDSPNITGLMTVVSFLNCVKKSLQSTAHPLDIPDDAKYYGTVTAGSRTIEGEGIKIKYGWEQFHYSMSVTMGCLPMTTFYFTEPTSFLFRFFEHEIKDPDLLVVPSFCENQPLEETPEGTVNSFLNDHAKYSTEQN
uniref:Uncharacterized protein n=1 Tax=Sphaeramia orbicularis TaxID=375764 RepID=A0A673AY81_9TELE